MYHVPYDNALGSLMYLMVYTRPYISHAIRVVSRCMENLGKGYRAVVKWVLRYLGGTSNYCITFNCSSDIICGYVDSNFVGDLNKMKSTSGYVFTLTGGPINWIPKIQNIVALFTT